MGLITGTLSGDAGYAVPEAICINLNEYNPELNKELKARLPGPARWDGDNKWWVFPLHWDTCVNTRKLAGEYRALIQIAPALSEWAIQEKKRRESIPNVQSMELTDLPTVREHYPDIWKAVSSRPFQTVGAAFAAHNHSCLVADQPGLGKTLQSIAAIIEAGTTGPILVVAPKAATRLVWPQELAHWVPNDEVVIIGSNLKPAERKAIMDQVADPNGGEWKGRLWVLTSPNYVRIKAEVDQYGKYVYEHGRKIIKPVGEGLLEIFDVPWSAVIVDESHQTLAGASGDKKKQSAQRVGLGALEVRENGLRLALSGTPFRGKEEYLWGQLNWLRPDLYRSRWRWINDHFEAYQDRYGMFIGAVKDRAKMYEEASNVMIRRTKAEVASDLPAKMYGGWPLIAGKSDSPVAVWLDMDDRQANAYKDIVNKAQAELEGGILMTTGVLAELTRLKQFAGSYGKMVGDHFTPTLPSNKFDWLVEFLDERGIDKAIHPEVTNRITDERLAELPKIVVASQFSQLIDCFAVGLAKEGILTHRFTGNTSDKDREYIKNDFQNDPNSPVRILMLTTTAGGVALTLDAADDLVILDETWNMSDQEQLEDRLHRLSRIHQVTIWNVRSRASIEEHIARANMESEFSIKAIMDGERGIDFSKKMLEDK